MQRLICPLLVLLVVLAAAAAAAAETKGKDTLASLRHDDRDRQYLVHLPSAYAKDRPWPLVMVFHGGGGNGRQMEELTGFSRKADREGFIAVYPYGTGVWTNRLLTWNSGNCCAYALEHGVDDSGFVRALIGDLQKRYAIDKHRIYATGISNGGMLSFRLACELADLIAAAGPVAGAQNVDCRPAQPVSIIMLNGTRDLYVRYEGGAPLRMADVRNPRVDRPVSETAAFWVRQNGCPETPKRETKGAVAVDTWAPCKAGTAVSLYTLEGEGHTWPGGPKWAWWADVPTKEISATDVIWAFFRSHPKQAQ